MKKSNKEIRNYATHYIKKLGGINELNNELSKAIQNLSEDGDAMSNVNQILFFTRVLLYLRYEYQQVRTS